MNLQSNAMSVPSCVCNFPMRMERFEGKNHVVAPVTLLVEGVHAGSGGAVFYPAEEIMKFPGAWNGVPLPVFHPTDGAGFPVSANNPQTVEKQSVGRLWNVKWDDNKLKGEVWIDVEKAKRISLDVLAMVQGQRKLEISTGLWFEPEPSSGKWNGEAYNAIARNIRPDHLALLPYGHGACSWDDGCGVRVNQTIRPGEMDETPLIIPQLNFNRRF